jgi:hypothetical protein
MDFGRGKIKTFEKSSRRREDLLEKQIMPQQC